MAGIVYDLVLLWYAERVEQGLPIGWVARPWYRSKTAPSFLDMLTAARQESWHRDVSVPPWPPRCPHNCRPSRSDTALAAA